ncbi:MAG: hypothetical protein RL113_823 [Pseudomonadota bacterium]|jgi:signal recognition particle receptor subunit beta
MIIIGHPWVESSRFVQVDSIDKIRHTQPNEIVFLVSIKASHEIAMHCQKNDVAYAVQAEEINDALFANALGAKYIVCKQDQAKQIQIIANEYLFDSRILTLIETEDQLQKIAKEGIDGVLFQDAISF